MNRRAIVYAAITLALILASATWFLVGKEGGHSSTPIVLHVIGEDYSPMQGLERIKSRYTAETGTQVNIVRTDAETLRKRYLAEFQAGADNYDVVMGQAFDIGLLAVNGWTLDVSEALSRPGWKDPKLDLSNFSDQLLDLSCRYKGKLYGLPCSAQCMFLWYRKDLFQDSGERQSFAERYGYPLPQPTAARSMTWKQYRDVAEFFTRSKGTKAAGQTLDHDLFGTVLQGKNHIALWFEFQNFLYSFGGSFIAADGKTVEATSPPSRQALQYYLGLRAFAPPGTVNYSWDEALASFQSGQVVTAIMWSDSISAVEDPQSSTVVGKVGFSANPTLEGGQPASVFGGWGLFVNRKSRYPKEALQFIQWANRPDVQVAWAKVGGFPAALSAYDSPELREVPGMAAHREALKHLAAWTREPYSARLVEVGQNNLAKAVAGEMTPDAVLQEIAARYQAILRTRPK